MNKTIIRRFLFILIFIIIWEIAVRLEIWPPMLFPSPISVFKSLVSGIQDNSLIIGIGVTLRRIFLGYSASVIVGVFIGLFMARFKAVEDTIGTMVLGLQNLPSICWLPLAILWWGYSENAIYFVTFMGSVLSITIGTDFGVKNVPPRYIRAGRNMGAEGLKLFRHVILPAALPSIINGMKQGWAFAWRSLMAAEIIFATLGLGFILQMGRELLDTSQVLAVMVTIVLIGAFFDRGVFSPIENHLRRKRGLV